MFKVNKFPVLHKQSLWRFKLTNASISYASVQQNETWLDGQTVDSSILYCCSNLRKLENNRLRGRCTIDFEILKVNKLLCSTY
jgi:hypothetical protein